MLETTSDDVVLLGDHHGIWGLKESSTITPTDIYIKYSNIGLWEVMCGNLMLMRVNFGVPSIPKRLIEEAKFKAILTKHFQQGLCNVDAIWDYTKKCTQQSHGTLLIISSNAQQEALRLGQQAFQIAPTKLTKAMLYALTATDGAILMDPSGICHGFGVILDGKAKESIGNPGRGARYNSAVRYIELSKEEGHSCIAVIVSSDNTVDVIET